MSLVRYSGVSRPEQRCEKWCLSLGMKVYTHFLLGSVETGEYFTEASGPPLLAPHIEPQWRAAWVCHVFGPAAPHRLHTTRLCVCFSCKEGEEECVGWGSSPTVDKHEVSEILVVLTAMVGVTARLGGPSTCTCRPAPIMRRVVTCRCILWIMAFARALLLQIHASLGDHLNNKLRPSNSILAAATLVSAVWCNCQMGFALPCPVF
jgi:hypothetical protein